MEYPLRVPTTEDRGVCGSNEADHGRLTFSQFNFYSNLVDGDFMPEVTL